MTQYKYRISLVGKCISPFGLLSDDQISGKVTHAEQMTQVKDSVRDNDSGKAIHAEKMTHPTELRVGSRKILFI